MYSTHFFHLAISFFRNALSLLSFVRLTFARSLASRTTFGFSVVFVFIVVAEDDNTALRIARRAYPVWHDSFNWLFRLHSAKLPRHQRPADFDGMAAQGRAVAGSPATVAAILKDRIAVSSANYLVGQHVFGDLTPEEATQSVELFSAHVMPLLQAQFPSPIHKSED